MKSRALQILKRELTPKNWGKVRGHIIKFMDRYREIYPLKNRRYFLDLMYVEMRKNTQYIEFRDQPNFKKEDIITFTNNTLKVIRANGPLNDYYTFLTKDESTSSN